MRVDLKPLRLLRQPVFLAVALSHFAVDVFNGQTGILLAVLSLPLGLTNATIGLIATIYAVVGSLSQPLFGWLTDRHGGRWAAAGGVIWMAAFFALAGVSPGYWPILCLIIGALGSGAFHPPGTMKAAQVGRVHMGGQMATAASIFFLFGQGGLSLGPAIGGVLMDYTGRPGLLLLAALAVPVGLFTAWAMRPSAQTTEKPGRDPSAGPAAPPPPADFALFGVVMLVAGLRTWAQNAVTTFAPKYFHDLGLAARTYGVIVALFMGGSAIGGVIGALLSERWGRRKTIMSACALSALPFFFFPLASGAWVYPLAVLAGLLNGAPHSILITMGQRSLPGRAALASGVILGFMFTAGTLGVYASGLAADQFGLARVLQANAVLGLSAALTGFALRSERARQQPAKVPAGD